MKCTLLRIRNCNRFDLSVLRDITITPQNPIQLVLGTNGTGKSSLFEFILPCAPAANDFERDGYYEHQSEHRGHTYKLTSTLDKGFKHTFSIDGGENLNTGGTQPIQWKLIEEHFGVTEDLIKLLLGRDTQYQFTEMRVGERRERLTQICPVDVDYALKFFQLVKQQIRSQKAVVEYIDSQLININGEHANVIANVDTGSLEEELKVRRADLENLMGFPLYDSTINQEQLLTTANDYAQLARGLITEISAYNGDTVKGEKQTIARLTKDLNVAQTQADSIVEEILSLDNILESVTAHTDGNPADIEKRIAELNDDLVRHAPRRTHLIGAFDANVAVQMVDAIAPSVNDLFQRWVDVDNKFTQSGYTEIQKEHESLQRSVTTALNAIASFEEHVKHLTTQPEQHCPKCNFRFHAGETASTSIAGVMTRIENGKKWVAEQQPRLTELEEQLSKYTEWFANVNELQGYIRSTPVLKPMWDDVIAMAAAQGYGYLAVKHFNDWCVDIEKLHNTAFVKEELERLETLLARLKAVDVEPLAKRRAMLYNRREALLESVLSLSNALVKNEDNLDVIQSILERRSAASGLDEKFKQMTLQYLQYLYTVALRGIIADTVRGIASIEKALGDANTIIAKRDELLQSKVEAEESYQIALAVAAELNPSNGLIADTIAGPINAFIEYMNTVIDSIWEYPLQILPCAIDAQGLNYKFPLLTEKHPLPRKDISNGSNGQKELINIAFIVALMHYKGFTDFPLLLDEFASTFDQLHQSNAMSFVKRLVDTQRVSQIWFISHYVLNHSAFSKADCIVLDKNNIVVPERYNDHVILN